MEENNCLKKNPIPIGMKTKEREFRKMTLI